MAARALIGALRPPLLLVAALLAAIVVSALGVIYSSHESRQLFNHLQELKREQLRLNERWGQLLLEQSTWASHERIEQIAKERLQMVMPDPEQIEVVPGG